MFLFNLLIMVNQFVGIIIISMGKKRPVLKEKLSFFLWELMKIFGEKCYQGNTNVFKDCLIEIEN